MDKPIVIQSNINIIINRYERERTGVDDSSQDEIIVNINYDSDGHVKNKNKDKEAMKESIKTKHKSLSKNESHKGLSKVDSFSNLNRGRDNSHNKSIKSDLSGSIIDFNDRIWINTSNTEARTRRLKFFKKESIKLDKFNSNHIDWIKKEFKAVITDEN